MSDPASESQPNQHADETAQATPQEEANAAPVEERSATAPTTDAATHEATAAPTASETTEGPAAEPKIAGETSADASTEDETTDSPSTDESEPAFAEESKPPASKTTAEKPAARQHTSDEVNDAGAYKHTDDTTERTRFNASRASHHVMIQLKHVENEVRAILEDRDSKRKRKLGGTARWQELEDDIIDWHYSGRFDQASLSRLRDLIFRRHSLFDRLRFLAATRPTWNS